MVRSMLDEEFDTEEFEPLPMQVPQTALEYLQAIYRNPAEPEHRRLSAAALALSFEAPKLSAVAVLRGENAFAAQLERAINRTNKVLELTPNPDQD